MENKMSIKTLGGQGSNEKKREGELLSILLQLLSGTSSCCCSNPKMAEHKQENSNTNIKICKRLEHCQECSQQSGPEQHSM